MVVMLVAVLFVNPLTFSGPAMFQGKMAASEHSGGRTILNVETADPQNYSTFDTVLYFGFLLLRILVAGLCFGWITLKSMPRVMANSQDSVHFWRLRKQAEKDLEQVGSLVYY